MSAVHYPLKTHRWSSHQQLVRLVPPGHRVLDIGCGPGFLAKLLTERGCEVVGVDRHVGDLARAVCARTYTRDLEQGLNLGEEPPFETVLLADVLSHLKAPEQLLEQCHRWLAPGGQLLMSVGNVAHLTVRLSLLFGRFEYAARGILERQHVSLFTLKSLTRFLASQQFRVTRVLVTPVPVEAVWPHAANAWWMNGLTAVSYVLAKLWKTLFAYQFIVVATPLTRPNPLDRIAVRVERPESPVPASA